MNYWRIGLCVFGGLIFVGPTQCGEELSSADLSIVIVTKTDRSGPPTIDRNDIFKVVFTNRSKRPIRLWSEWCREGNETLSFLVGHGNGLPTLMHKRSLDRWEQGPEYDRPRTLIIPPGESHSWESLPFAICDRTWIGVPETNTGSLIALTAVFEIKSAEATKKHGVWVGRIVSDPIKVLLVDPDLRTPHEYLSANCPQQALRLMQADRTWIRKTDDGRQTPLHVAAQFGQVEVARWLLAHGAEIEARCYNEFTPLLCTEHPEIVKLLLEHKADVNAKNFSNRTALEEAASEYACRENDPAWAKKAEDMQSIIKMLLAAGAEYDIRSACYLNDFERVRALVADKNQAQDREAMRWAATYGRVKIVKLLLEHGADPESDGYFGLTVPYFALKHAEVLKLLLNAGANPRVRVEYEGCGVGPQGSTLLHEAVAIGAVESAKLLLERGADANAKNAFGMTPLAWASGSNQVPAMIKLLRDHGGTK